MEVRGQKSEDSEQTTEVRSRRSENREQSEKSLRINLEIMNRSPEVSVKVPLFFG
jgi:hypothetical protein